MNVELIFDVVISVDVVFRTREVAKETARIAPHAWVKIGVTIIVAVPFAHHALSVAGMKGGVPVTSP